MPINMESNDLALLPQCSKELQIDVSVDADENVIKVCPLCNSNVRLFFINFNEKMLMCENTLCEYPFGHADLLFVKEDESLPFDEELASVKKSSLWLPTSAMASPIVSTGTWSDVDKLSRVCEAEEKSEKQLDTRSYELRINSSSNEELRKKKLEAEKKLDNDIEEINNLTKELLKSTEENVETTTIIKNQRWIKNLKSMEAMSGVKLLKREEMKMLKLKKVNKEDVRINIEMNQDSATPVPSIKIELGKCEHWLKKQE